MSDTDLDLEVARKVMGWDWVLHPYVVINERRHDIPTYLPPGSSPEDALPGTYAGQGPVRYSHSIKDAWRVVERLEAQDWRVSISQSSKGHWRCSFGRVLGSNSDRRGEAWGGTPAEAICLASLDAVKEKPDE